MAHGDVKHDYHLVNPSPWPFVASVGALDRCGRRRGADEGLCGRRHSCQGAMVSLRRRHDHLVFTCFGWWGDVIKESRQGDHTPVVDIGLRYGMILFIASEVMFFVAWFWV